MQITLPTLVEPSVAEVEKQIRSNIAFCSEAVEQAVNSTYQRFDLVENRKTKLWSLVETITPFGREEAPRKVVRVAEMSLEEANAIAGIMYAFSAPAFSRGLQRGEANIRKRVREGMTHAIERVLDGDD